MSRRATARLGLRRTDTALPPPAQRTRREDTVRPPSPSRPAVALETRSEARPVPADSQLTRSRSPRLRNAATEDGRRTVASASPDSVAPFTSPAAGGCEAAGVSAAAGGP